MMAIDVTGDSDEMEWESGGGSGAGAGAGVEVKQEGGVKSESGGKEEAMRQKKEEQRQKRREQQRERVKCKYCGAMVSRSGLARHQKTGGGKDQVTRKHIPCCANAVAAGVFCNLACCKDL